EFVQRSTFPWPLADDALRLRTIDDFPRLADLFSRRKPFTKMAFHPLPAPDALHEQRLENQRLEEQLLHVGGEISPSRFICQTRSHFGVILSAAKRSRRTPSKVALR